MLEVGNDGITFEEARTHFAFWAAMKSPLIIGADVSFFVKDFTSVKQANTGFLLAHSNRR